jgi:hypothetical protein
MELLELPKEIPMANRSPGWAAVWSLIAKVIILWYMRLTKS